MGGGRITCCHCIALEKYSFKAEDLGLLSQASTQSESSRVESFLDWEQKCKGTLDSSGSSAEGNWISLSAIPYQVRPLPTALVHCTITDLSPGDRKFRPLRQAMYTTPLEFELTVRSSQPISASPLFSETTRPHASFTLYGGALTIRRPVWGGSNGVINFLWILLCNAEFSPCWALPEYIRALIYLSCLRVFSVTPWVIVYRLYHVRWQGQCDWF